MTLTCDHCGELYDGGDRAAERRRRGNGLALEMFSCWPCFSNSIDRTPMSNPVVRQFLNLPASASDEQVRDTIKGRALEARRKEVRPA